MLRWVWAWPSVPEELGKVSPKPSPLPSPETAGDSREPQLSGHHCLWDS